MIKSKEIQPERHDYAINVQEFLQLLRENKWVIGATTVIATVIAVVIAVLLPNIYSAEALLAPNETNDHSDLASLASRYAGFASLVGIDSDNPLTDRTTLGIEILQSRKFISAFVRRHDLLVPLIAAKGWNPDTNSLIIESAEYNVETGEWVRKVRAPRKVIPTLQEAYEEFLDVLSVTQDLKSGYVTIAIEHYSPFIAKQWVDWLVEDVNSEILEQDVEEAEQAIMYLNEQIEATSLAELQNVFFRLIEEQIKTIMLARMSPEYVFKTIDPAVVPEVKAKPSRALIVVVGLLIGFLSSVLFVVVASASRTQTDV